IWRMRRRQPRPGQDIAGTNPGLSRMLELAAAGPCRRPELVFSPAAEPGRYVVKDPDAGHYFTIGEEEYYLLTQLDGEQSTSAICATFAERFGQPLPPEELDEFLDVAREQGLLQSEQAREVESASSRTQQSRRRKEASSRRGRPRVSWQGLL